MATIQVLSDLHIEFQLWQPVPTAADVVVLAGDIHCGGQTVGWVKQAFPDRPVVLVLGNHDYWNHTDINGALDKAREETAGTHIHLGNPQFIRYPRSLSFTSSKRTGRR